MVSDEQGVSSQTGRSSAMSMGDLRELLLQLNQRREQDVCQNIYESQERQELRRRIELAAPGFFVEWLERHETYVLVPLTRGETR